MAFPTAAAARAVVVAWWRAPGRPRLSDLRARMATIVTDPFCSVRVRVFNTPPLTLEVTLERRDAAGIVQQTVVRTLTKEDFDALNERPADLGDCLEFHGTLREQGDVP